MTLEEALAELAIERDFIPAGSSNRPGTKITPAYITIHNTDNPDSHADARMHARYVKGPHARAREVSWHFTVDDVRCVQHLPTDEIGWHAGRGNGVSVAIEICQHAGIRQTVADERAALLTAVLMFQLAIDTTHVVPHRHWTGKDCPKLILRQQGHFAGFADRAAELGAQLTSLLVADTSMLVETEMDSIGSEKAATVNVPIGTHSSSFVTDASRLTLLEELIGRKEMRIAELERELEEARTFLRETN